MAKHVDPAFAAGALRVRDHNGATGRESPNDLVRLHQLRVEHERHKAPFEPVVEQEKVITDADRKDALIARGVSEAVACKLSKTPGLLEFALRHEELHEAALGFLAARPNLTAFVPNDLRMGSADSMRRVNEILLDDRPQPERPGIDQSFKGCSFPVKDALTQKAIVHGVMHDLSAACQDDMRRASNYAAVAARQGFVPAPDAVEKQGHDIEGLLRPALAWLCKQHLAMSWPIASKLSYRRLFTMLVECAILDEAGVFLRRDLVPVSEGYVIRQSEGRSLRPRNTAPVTVQEAGFTGTGKTAIMKAAAEASGMEVIDLGISGTCTLGTADLASYRSQFADPSPHLITNVTLALNTRTLMFLKEVSEQVPIEVFPYHVLHAFRAGPGRQDTHSLNLQALTSVVSAPNTADLGARFKDAILRRLTDETIEVRKAKAPREAKPVQMAFERVFEAMLAQTPRDRVIMITDGETEKPTEEVYAELMSHAPQAAEG